MDNALSLGEIEVNLGICFDSITIPTFARPHVKR
jgi:hypothetical protein